MFGLLRFPSVIGHRGCQDITPPRWHCQIDPNQWLTLWAVRYWEVAGSCVLVFLLLGVHGKLENFVYWDSDDSPVKHKWAVYIQADFLRDKQFDSKIKAKFSTVSFKFLQYLWNFFFRLPTVESVLEIMLTKMDPKAMQILKDSPLCIVNDFNNMMSGQTISYLELCQGMISSKVIMRDIYTPPVPKVANFDALKEIALEPCP